MSSYQIIDQSKAETKNETNAIGTSNIIEESFVNATSNDIYTNFEEELVTEDMTESELQTEQNIVENQENSDTVPTTTIKKQDEFDIFGNFVAEVMRNMTKVRMRRLQMDIMKLIADVESEN